MTHPDPTRRKLSEDERLRYGECPVCDAPHGEYCAAEVGLQLGQPVGGGRMQTGSGAHLARLRAAPNFVREVPCE